MEETGSSRRSFLKTSLAAGALAVTRPSWSGAASPDGGLLERTGVARYTVREQMKADPAGTLKAIFDLGYRYFEVDLFPSIAPALEVAGLKQVSAYAPTFLLTGNRQAWGADANLVPEDYTWDKAIDEAKARGLEYLIIVYLQKAERGGLDVYKALAAKLDKAGAVCRKAGLGLAYHPHNFEYEPIDGVRPIDILLKETAPAHLALELDTFWASIAGQDPTKMLEAHKGRVPLVHLKDKAKGTPVQFANETVPHEAFKEVGNGEIDFAAFFKVAKSAGVKYLFVEQDYCTGSPLDSLRTSRANVAKLAAGRS